MSSRITLFFWGFISLCAPCLSNAPTVFERADSLYEARNFARAALEYERVIYRGATAEEINTALFGRVACFKQMERFAGALSELLRIRIYTLTGEQTTAYFYEKILCSYLGQSFNEALGAIDQMYLTVADSASCNATLLLQTLVLNELQLWGRARQTALKFARTLPHPASDTLQAEIEKLYSPKNIPKMKKEKVAKVLAFIPGAAHIYAGFPAEGSVSFLLNAAMLSFGVYQVWTGCYVTGYLLGAGALSATYLGGFNRAGFLLQQHNYEQTRRFNDHVRDELLRP